MAEFDEDFVDRIHYYGMPVVADDKVLDEEVSNQVLHLLVLAEELLLGLQMVQDWTGCHSLKLAPFELPLVISTKK